MSSLAQQVSASALRDRVFNDRQLSEMLGGGDARRYGLVNRAIKDGSLIRLKRGVYALAPAYRSAPMHPFAVAQALLPGSYISFESALTYHRWIPEAVLVTASVTPGRKTLEIPATEFGPFKYHPLAIADYCFLSGVERVTFDKLTAFVAKPLRALMDLVALRKVEWSGLDWLTSGMRIDDDLLLALTETDFAAVKSVYKHRAVNAFLAELEHGVVGAKRAE
jgi:hypothetical protein